MIELEEEIKWLKEYASKHKIHDLSSEEIIKLMVHPYLISEICDVFNITEKEFNEIRKNKGITNINLEDSIRDIKTILQYIDDLGKYVSNNVRQKVVEYLNDLIFTGVPRKNYYQKQILKTDFSREKILKDLEEKEIDQEYRLNKLKNILPSIEHLVSSLIEEEKTKILKYNKEQLYKKLCTEKEKGKKFTKEDLVYDVLYELSVIEGIPDSLVSDLFNIGVGEVRYLRKKYGFANKFKRKMKDYPEGIIYFIEEKNERIKGASNYDYEKMLDMYNKETYKEEDIAQVTDEINIEVDGKM